ncbi:MAG TPA: hypothetical protein VM597_01985 [Gemmataceae bacterium]|nr:hypothetical protein [Gemmataceae bacterium]
MGDATKATITIQSPRANELITRRSVTVSGSWSGPALTNPKVEVKMGGLASGPITPNADGTWEYTFEGVANGPYGVVAYLSADSKAPVDNGPVPIKVAAPDSPNG